MIVMRQSGSRSRKVIAAPFPALPLPMITLWVSDAMGYMSWVTKSKRSIEMHLVGQTMKQAPQRMHSLLSIQIAPTSFHWFVSISSP
jgi:hypothetical protein